MMLKPLCVLISVAILGLAQSTAPTTAKPEQSGTASGFASPATDPPPAAKAEAAPEKKPGGPITSIEEARKIPYTVGPLDVLAIKVWNNQNLTGMYDVRPDGMLSMPLIGEFKADGMTVQELKAALNQKVRDAGQKNPDIDVQVTKVNSKKYYITGGVKKTGEFPLPEPITVMDAISMAGGFTDFANQKKIYVLRDGHQYFFNFKEVSKGKNPQQNIVIMNGDHIFVPE